MDTLSPEERSERMRRVRACDTKPEVRLRKLIWRLGYRYRKNRRDVCGNPDVAFMGRKRAIFLHGCFWHRHDCPSGRRVPKSRVEFWTGKFQRNVERDRAVDVELATFGWRSLVIWECELRDVGTVEQRVREFLDA
ncbi:MAG: very short patch repair endonuclease [Sphingomonas sp.]|nr:MAG: very short patch repair endonuclease [Sphingomonas sp.]